MRHLDKVEKLEIALAAIGLLVSLYLTLHHYLPIPLACSNSGLFNCNNVLNSVYATAFGVPTAVYGIIFFIFLLLALLYGRREHVLGLLSIGMIIVLYLIRSEFIIGNICEYCTAVHVIITTLFIISVYRYLKHPGPKR